MQLHLIFVQVSSKVRMLSADSNEIHVSSCELTCRSGSSLLSTGSSSCMAREPESRESHIDHCFCDVNKPKRDAQSRARSGSGCALKPDLAMLVPTHTSHG